MFHVKRLEKRRCFPTEQWLLPALDEALDVNLHWVLQDKEHPFWCIMVMRAGKLKKWYAGLKQWEVER
jgi:hypothetical protein